MKVLFINFNIGSTPGINNGIACLSAVLKERNHRTALIFLCEQLGYGFDPDRIRKDILSEAPDIIGLSLIETQLKYAKALMKGLREYYKGLVVCGGPYPTMDPEGCLEIDGVDAVCVGEGEDALVELAEAVESGKRYDGIRNIWVRRGNTVIKNKLRPFKSLYDLPPDDKELFDLDRILPLKNYQLETMIGRGCVYQCSYCINDSYMKKYRDFCERRVGLNDYVRFKDAVKAAAEIKDTVSKHPQVKKIAFIDDNFITDEKYLAKLCGEYKKAVGLPFMCNVNPASYNERKARILKEAGCDDVRFGIESGSERVKKEVMKRPVPNRSVLEAFRINKELDMMTSSFNMIGLPTETKEEVLETLKLNAQIMPDTVKVMTFYPFKNTPIYGFCEGLGLIDTQAKEELDNYDSFTCLKFPEEYRLFLRKVQVCFNWYLNSMIGNEASGAYRELVEKVEGMSGAEWDGYDFCAEDSRISGMMKADKLAHYTKYMNRSLAVKWPSRHLE
ncbi:MAG: radical SAM protein [Candidatus Omnitrophica bacterium]|nr:radical SAM protein [Candidatus Omnitrophota bacterium]MDD5736854.1 radical SAM protein [Candidatus Omnitrophota bacterium]